MGTLIRALRHGLAHTGLVIALFGLTACGGGGGGGGDVTAPYAPAVNLDYAIKQLQFSWSAVDGATHYKLLENPDGISGYTQVGGNLTGTRVDHAIALFRRLNASYIVSACNSAGCTDAEAIFLADRLASAIGYGKASNTGADDYFGYALALSADGTTLAVGAYYEDSAATGIDGDETDNTAANAGAVYVFTRNTGAWVQQAYLKASTVGEYDYFGSALSLSADGATLAVGAYLESSSAGGIDGDETNNSAAGAGAAYVFTRSAGAWSQQAYLKASNTGAGDMFGYALTLSGDGNTLAVGAYREDSDATAIDGDESNNSATDAGAVYLFTRGAGIWSQQTYLKASNNGAGDAFGIALALAADGNTLAIGSSLEDSAATGVGGDETDNAAANAGAVYVFTRSGGTWSQQAYLKASNSGAGDAFGISLALSADGNTLAIGAYQEDSNASGIDGDQSNNLVTDSGAVYLFSRSAGAWSQQAYLKASTTGAYDYFGWSLTLSADGNTLAVGAYQEDSNATAIDGDESNNSATDAGAVYLFTRGAGIWSQQAYLKAANTQANDFFGVALALSADGNTLAIGANGEDGNASGVCASGACATAQADNSASNAGAIYLY